MKKYYVHFVDDCTPKLAEFDTLKEAKLFFDDRPDGVDDASWADFMFVGDVLATTDHYSDIVRPNEAKLKTKKKAKPKKAKK